ncbi:Nn.00g098160.m01.CDS01 [Neocucurbitaria sp. VM-36]
MPDLICFLQRQQQCVLLTFVDTSSLVYSSRSFRCNLHAVITGIFAFTTTGLQECSAVLSYIFAVTFECFERTQIYAFNQVIYGNFLHA